MTSYAVAHYVILMMTFDNVQCWPKAETLGAGAEKVKISANRDNLITKIFLAI